MFKWTCVVALIALALTFICGYILELNHVHRLPEAGVGLIFGFMLALGAKLFHNVEMLADEQFAGWKMGIDKLRSLWPPNLKRVTAKDGVCSCETCEVFRLFLSEYKRFAHRPLSNILYPMMKN